MKRSFRHYVRRTPLAAAIAAVAAGSAQFLGAQPVLAQEAPREQRVLEEVLVTARKQEESVQDVPVSIVPVTDTALKANHVVSVLDLPQIVPGLTVMVNSQGGAPTFAIRAAKADNGTSDTVTAYIDDVPIAMPVGIANMTYDLQSISVLKGPQGTFFGTSTTGGAMIFRPNKPTGEFEGYVEAGAGDYNLWNTEGMVNVPISDTVQVRVAGNWYNRDEGFVNNRTPGNGNPGELNDDEYYSGRGTLRLQPNEKLLSDTEFHYYESDHEINQEILVALRDRFNYRTFLGGLEVPVDWALAGVTVPGGTEDVATGPHPSYYQAEMQVIANTTTYEINDNVSVKSVLSWQNIETDTSQDNDTTPRAIVNGRTAHDLEQWTAEFSLDWATSDERVRNKTGVFFLDKELETGNHYKLLDLPYDAPPLAGLLASFYPLASINNYKREFESQAIYSQFTVQITDIWTMTFGGRYTWDKGDYAANGYTVLGRANVDAIPWGVFSGPYPCSGALALYDDFDPVACTGTREFEDSAASGLLTFEGRFGDHLAYVSTRHGYLVGGFNNNVSVRQGQLFAPEQVDDLEIGLKSDWQLAGSPIRTNIALFYGQYTDQQRVQNGADPDTGATYISVGNAGSTTFYGLDLDVTYQPTENLTLTLGWNNVTAEYDEFEAPLNMPNVPGGVQFIDLEGEQAAQTPKNIVTASATYVWPLGSHLGELSSSVSYSWRDDTTHHDSPSVICTLVNGECRPENITTSFTDLDEIPAYDLVNFSTSWRGVMGSPFDVRLWVKNVFDEEYEVYGSNQMAQFGYATYFYGNPREYGLNLRYNF